MKLIAILVLAGFISFASSCQTTGLQVLNAVDPEGNRLYATASPWPLEAFQARFQSRDLESDEGKIDFLLSRIQESPHIFIRNRIEYSGPFASEYLRWKIGRIKMKNIPVHTVDQFLTNVATKSNITGNKYLMKTKNAAEGERYYYLADVLENERHQLEQALKEIHRTQEMEAEAVKKQEAELLETSPESDSEQQI